MPDAFESGTCHIEGLAGLGAAVEFITDVGLDHWGRYVDEYRTVDGQWKFARRRVTVDGKNPSSLFIPD